jgi:hypothetical protein
MTCPLTPNRSGPNRPEHFRALFRRGTILCHIAQTHIAGLCMPDALSAANHTSIESMRNFLLPSLKWLVGISVALHVNLDKTAELSRETFTA